MKNNNIILSKEIKAGMLDKIQTYFLKERDEEIGFLASSMFLDFITEELAAEFYNQGVMDCYNYITDKCEDLLSIQK